MLLPPAGGTSYVTTVLNERKHLKMVIRSVPDSFSLILDQTERSGLSTLHRAVLVDKYCRADPSNGRQDMAKQVAEIKISQTQFKTLAYARVNRCDHSSWPAQEVGRLAKRALFKSVLYCCCTAPVTRSVASVPCQRSGRTFRDCKVGTRPEPCGFQVR
jgi:hypothetical protein